VILSRTAQYALRALVFLSRHGREGPVRVDVVATELDLPRNYLSKILHALVGAGVLVSLRGPKGGFQLARRAGDTRLADVVGHFDPPEDSSKCLLGRPECTDHNPCAAHERWQEVRDRYTRFLDDLT